MHTYEIPIQGMHCRACTIVVADELKKIPGVTAASASLKTNKATIRAASRPSQRALADAIATAGYRMGDAVVPVISRDKLLYMQVGASVAIVAVVYFALRAIGFDGVHIGVGAGAGGITALLVGLAAGFSTCMALVGGLVLGLSARFAAQHPDATPMQKFRPHVLFNIGRIVSFVVLGGAVGALGAMFALSGWLLGVLTIAVGLIMAVIGLQLTGVFPRLSVASLALPEGLSKLLGLDRRKQRAYSERNALLLGGLTFFLPCGFTQAMQLVAITSGSVATGALVMGLFAVGTTPGLLGVGGLTSALKGDTAKTFFRVIGVVVIALALYNVVGGVRQTGWQLPQRSAIPAVPAQSGGVVSSAPAAEQAAPIVLKATYSAADGIQPAIFKASIGTAYVLEIEAKDDGEGCMSTAKIPGLYAKPQLLQKGQTLRMPFKPKDAGTYHIVCAMGVPFGNKIIVGA